MYRFDMRATLVFALPVLLSGCTVGAFGLGEQTAVYSVTGAGSAQISYVDGGAQSGVHELPFRVEVSAPVAPNQFHLNAIADGDVTCTLTVDGEVVAKQTGRVVSCSG